MPTPPEYFVPRPESSLDAGVRKALNGQPLTSDEDFDTLAANLSPEQIKVLFNKAARSEQQKAADVESRQNSDTWCQLHSEYVDNPANAALMNHQLRTMGIENPTVQDLELAYEQLKFSGFLKLNQAELARQQKAAAQDRANGIREQGGVFPQFNESEAEGLDLEEVRRLANIQMGRR